MKSAYILFAESIGWLKHNFQSFHFYVERDIVWTVQKHLIEEIEKSGSNLTVFNDLGLLPGKKRRLSPDLAIIGPNRQVELIVEFKYEPNHKRIDIPKDKFPVVFWGMDGVQKDINRLPDFVNKAGTHFAISLFIDEGSAFRHRVPHPNSRWVDWPDGISVLIAECISAHFSGTFDDLLLEQMAK